MYDHMLIDARNAAHRAIYAGLADQAYVQSNYDFSVIFFRFISSYLNKFKPKAVHLFWDSPKETLWRRVIAPEYKATRDTSHADKYGVNLEELLTRITTVISELAPAINTRNYQRGRQEADDLIYAFCRLRVKDRIVVVSSDKDFRQLPDMFRNVDLFHPQSKDGTVYVPNETDPVEEKCFIGENTDNIGKYHLVGPVAASKLINNFKQRKQFFAERGHETYTKNRALTDLSLCPYALHNMRYIQDVLAEDISFDLARVRETIQRYKVRGLQTELSRVILPFKNVGSTPVEGAGNGNA